MYLGSSLGSRRSFVFIKKEIGVNIKYVSGRGKTPILYVQTACGCFYTFPKGPEINYVIVKWGKGGGIKNITL